MEFSKPDFSKLKGSDFLDGQLLLIDKPLGWTSFDAVKKVRNILKQRFKFKKLKVGHAGTLDPLATGLLIICTGRFTKRIAELTLEDKAYTGTFTIGAITPSYDLETDPTDFKDIGQVDLPQIQKAAEELTGVQDQLPPIFSAKWVDGKRAYESARKGEAIEMKTHRVDVKKFDIEVESLPEVQFHITCSKGTYIRSIARDLGEKIEVGAYLSALRRISIGNYKAEDAISPQAFQDQLNSGKTDEE